MFLVIAWIVCLMLNWAAIFSVILILCNDSRFVTFGGGLPSLFLSVSLSLVFSPKEIKV